MNLAAFVIIAFITLCAAVAAAMLPKLIHAALSLVVTFIGVAAFYILLGAEFIGLVQVLVYVGAVAVLIVFTILLTHQADEKKEEVNFWGIVVAFAVFGCLTWAVINTALPAAGAKSAALTVNAIGGELMTNYVWPLQCVGLVLTAALIGALVLVMEEKK